MARYTKPLAVLDSKDRVILLGYKVDWKISLDLFKEEAEVTKSYLDEEMKNKYLSCKKYNIYVNRYVVVTESFKNYGAKIEVLRNDIETIINSKLKKMPRTEVDRLVESLRELGPKITEIRSLYQRFRSKA